MRHLGKVDVAQLREAVLAIPESVWDAKNQKKPNQRYTAVNQARHIVFRFITNKLDWRESADWPLWQQWRERLLPVMEQATRPYGYVRAAYPRVMLARMASGAEIAPHVDANPAA